MAIAHQKDCSARARRPIPKNRASVHNGGYASSHDYRLNCGPRSADRGGRKSRSREHSGWGARLTGEGRQILSDEEVAAYYARAAQLAPTDMLTWLHSAGITLSPEVGEL